MKLITFRNKHEDSRVERANQVSELLLTQYVFSLRSINEFERDIIDKEFVENLDKMYENLDENIRNWYEIINEDQTPLFQWRQLQKEQKDYHEIDWKTRLNICKKNINFELPVLNKE